MERWRFVDRFEQDKEINAVDPLAYAASSLPTLAANRRGVREVTSTGIATAFCPRP